MISESVFLFLERRASSETRLRSRHFQSMSRYSESDLDRRGFDGNITYVAASGDGDDAAEKGGATEEREEIGDEAVAGVEC